MLTGIEKIVDGLKTSRDEISLKIHLGSKDLRDQWDVLERKWHAFEIHAGLEKTADGVNVATRLLASELKDGYERLRKAL
jgi:hypothetical protein